MTITSLMASAHQHENLPLSAFLRHPAFLGNASQQGQWRTPRVKALLRQWWRMAVTQQVRYHSETLRQRENALFGTAADGDGDSRQSLIRIRIRLRHWNMGQLKDWPSTGTVTHPEVKSREGKPTPVGSDLYLGFGPLEYNSNSRGTTIKHKVAIQTALWLMDRYGTLGALQELLAVLGLSNAYLNYKRHIVRFVGTGSDRHDDS